MVSRFHDWLDFLYSHCYYVEQWNWSIWRQLCFTNSTVCVHTLINASARISVVSNELLVEYFYLICTWMWLIYYALFQWYTLPLHVHALRFTFVCAHTDTWLGKLDWSALVGPADPEWVWKSWELEALYSIVATGTMLSQDGKTRYNYHISKRNAKVSPD